MFPPTNNWRVKRTEHRFMLQRNGHRNAELRHIIGQHKRTKEISNTDPTKNLGVNSCAREVYAVAASDKPTAVLRTYSQVR